MTTIIIYVFSCCLLQVTVVSSISDGVTAVMLCLTRRQCFGLALAVVAIESVGILLSGMKLHLWSINEEPIEQLNGYAESEPAESFLSLYKSYCDLHFYPKASNVPSEYLPNYNSSLCACVPDTLGMLRLF